MVGTKATKTNKPKKKKTKVKWKNRIVDQALLDPKELNPNALNPVKHPAFQKQLMGEALDKIGWIQDIIVNKTTGNTYINLDTITISQGLYVSGPAVVESTDSTITGKFVTVHPCSSLTFGEGDTLQDDSYIVGSKVQFNAQNLSASNNVELTGATVTVTNTQSGALAIGAFNLNRESRLVLDCPIVPTAGTITSYGGRVDSDHPLTFTLSAYGKLSTTAFRALDFENAQNSGHFQTGIMA